MSLANMLPGLPENSAPTRPNSDGAKLGHSDNQLELLGYLDGKAAEAHMIALVRDVVDCVGLKEAAFQLDMSPSDLSHCLARRKRMHIPIEALPKIVKMAKDNQIPSFIAAIRGLAAVPRETMTPEQRLARLEQAMAEELGPGVRKAIHVRAFGEELKR